MLQYLQNNYQFVVVSLLLSKWKVATSSTKWVVSETPKKSLATPFSFFYFLKSHKILIMKFVFVCLLIAVGAYVVINLRLLWPSLVPLPGKFVMIRAIMDNCPRWQSSITPLFLVRTLLCSVLALWIRLSLKESGVWLDHTWVSLCSSNRAIFAVTVLLIFLSEVDQSILTD